jgi:hypothetical protein
MGDPFFFSFSLTFLGQSAMVLPGLGLRFWTIFGSPRGRVRPWAIGSRRSP